MPKTKPEFKVGGIEDEDFLKDLEREMGGASEFGVKALQEDKRKEEIKKSMADKSSKSG